MPLSENRCRSGSDRMNKGLYIVLSGSKELVEANQKEIEQFLNKFTRKVGKHENCRCAKIHREIDIDKETNTGSRFKLDDFSSTLQSYLKGYKAVVLKYSHYGKIGKIFVRGRRWRINKKGKEVYK